MMTISVLLFNLLALATLLCLGALLGLWHSPSMKSWYGLFLFSYIGWGMFVYAQPATPFVLYLIPAIWFVGTLAVGFPKHPNLQLPPQLSEPFTTEEYLRGPAGTREALIYYFTLTLLGLLVATVLLLPSIGHGQDILW
jgi:hypothetical protein